MSQIRGRPADVYFGEVADEEVNWREELTDDKDPDDEELAETPPDVWRSLASIQKTWIPMTEFRCDSYIAVGV
jgi:hypothetical protein